MWVWKSIGIIAINVYWILFYLHYKHSGIHEVRTKLHDNFHGMVKCLSRIEFKFHHNQLLSYRTLNRTSFVRMFSQYSINKSSKLLRTFCLIKCPPTVPFKWSRNAPYTLMRDGSPFFNCFIVTISLSILSVHSFISLLVNSLPWPKSCTLSFATASRMDWASFLAGSLISCKE